MDSDGKAGVREGGAGQAWEAQTGPRKFSLQLIFTSLFNLPPRVTGLPVVPDAQQTGSATDMRPPGDPRTQGFTPPESGAAGPRGPVALWWLSAQVPRHQARPQEQPL